MKMGDASRFFSKVSRSGVNDSPDQGFGKTDAPPFWVHLGLVSANMDLLSAPKNMA